MDLQFGYVKFESDNSSPIYELVCINTMKIYFDEFRIFDMTINELENEYHQGFIIINRLPIISFKAFKTLTYFAHTNVMIYEKSDEEQIQLLFLISKLTRKEEFYKISSHILFNNSVWVKLLDENYDVKNFFDDYQKLSICTGIIMTNPKLEKEKIFQFYGLMYFKNLPGYNISHLWDLGHQQPQKRIHIKSSQYNYRLTTIDEYAILYDPCEHCPIIKKRNSIERVYSTASNLSHDMILSKLSKEYIGTCTLPLYNYIICNVDVQYGNNIIPAQLIQTTFDDGYNGFAQIYKKDFEELYSSKPYDILLFTHLQEAAFIKYDTDGIYVPPKL